MCTRRKAREMNDRASNSEDYQNRIKRLRGPVAVPVRNTRATSHLRPVRDPGQMCIEFVDIQQDLDSVGARTYTSAFNDPVQKAKRQSQRTSTFDGCEV